MQLHIEMPGQCERPGDLLAAIDRALAGQQLAPGARNDLRLITEEVVCNALEHGLHGPHEEAWELVFDLRRRGDTLHLEFRDRGKPFDPLAQPPPDLDGDILDRPIGGLGLHLVRELAETISYRREEPYNVLHIVLRAA